MASSKKQSTVGMIVLHVCKEDDALRKEYRPEGKPGVVSQMAVRAQDVVQAKPLTPLWASNARSFVHFAEGEGQFVTETVEEIAGLVNRQSTVESDIRRIAIAMEAIVQYGIKQDVA